MGGGRREGGGGGFVRIDSYSTNHVYLHKPNAFGFLQMRLHLCYETLKLKLC